MQLHAKQGNYHSLPGSSGGRTHTRSTNTVGVSHWKKECLLNLFLWFPQWLQRRVPFKFSFHSHCNLFPHSCCSCPRLWKGMNLKNFSTYLQVFFLLFYLYLNSSCENHFLSSLLLEEVPALFVSNIVVLIYSSLYMLFRTTLNWLFIAT